MAEYFVKGPAARKPTHPGMLLREDVLPALGISVSELARQLHVSRQTLHAILAGRKSITPAMALRLGKFIGNGPELWLNMQQAHDLWTAKQSLARELESIPHHEAA
jgi:addiction module HigA family antidote